MTTGSLGTISPGRDSAGCTNWCQLPRLHRTCSALRAETRAPGMGAVFTHSSAKVWFVCERECTQQGGTSCAGSGKGLGRGLAAIIVYKICHRRSSRLPVDLVAAEWGSPLWGSCLSVGQNNGQGGVSQSWGEYIGEDIQIFTAVHSRGTFALRYCSIQ